MITRGAIELIPSCLGYYGNGPLDQARIRASPSGFCSPAFAYNTLSITHLIF